MDLHADVTDVGVFARGEHHELFRRLRAEDPVHYCVDEAGAGMWNLTLHADIVAASRSPEVFSSAIQGVNLLDLDDDPRPHAHLERDMLGLMDPPRHTTYRGMSSQYFTPRAIRDHEAAIRSTAREMIESALAREQCDFSTEIAGPLPQQTIIEMVGVPTEDVPMIVEWLGQLIVGQDDAWVEFCSYSSALRKRQESHPTGDLATLFDRATINGNALSDMEFALYLFQLIAAGGDTARSALTHGVLALIDRPDAYAALRSDPSNLDQAIEEILRWSTPVMHFRRTATRDVSVGDKEIQRGDRVVLWYVSANRDESVFVNPDRFAIERSPNPHLAYGGGGPHFCLGAHLARLEIRIVLEELLARVVSIESAGPITRLPSNWLSAVQAMPVVLHPA